MIPTTNTQHHTSVGHNFRTGTEKTDGSLHPTVGRNAVEETVPNSFFLLFKKNGGNIKATHELPTRNPTIQGKHQMKKKRTKKRTTFSAWNGIFPPLTSLPRSPRLYQRK